MNMIKDFRIKILDAKNIPYDFKNKTGSTMRLHFNSNGILIISYPRLVKKESITSFVEKNIEWIEKKNLEYLSRLVSYEDGSYQYIFGKKCLLKVNISKTRRIDLINDILIVSVNKLEDVRKDLIKWRKEKAEVVFQEILYKCFDKMKYHLDSFPNLIIKTSKTKWGCCYFKENKIMLNIALTQVPLELIEYVIFHELTHMVVHNHSKEFHQFLRMFVPEEKEKFKKLKIYNNIL